MVTGPSWTHAFVLLYQHLRTCDLYVNALVPFALQSVQLDHSEHVLLIQSFCSWPPSHTFDAVSMVTGPPWSHASVLLYQHLRFRIWNPNAFVPFAVQSVQLDHSVHGFFWQISCTTVSSKFTNECPISFSIELLKLVPIWISFSPSASILNTETNLFVLEALQLLMTVTSKVKKTVLETDMFLSRLAKRCCIQSVPQ